MSSPNISKAGEENKDIHSSKAVHYLSQTNDVSQKVREDSYKSMTVSMEKSRRPYLFDVFRVESPEIEVIEPDTESLKTEKLYTKHERRELAFEIVRKIVSFSGEHQPNTNPIEHIELNINIPHASSNSKRCFIPINIDIHSPSHITLLNFDTSLPNINYLISRNVSTLQLPSYRPYEIRIPQINTEAPIIRERITNTECNVGSSIPIFSKHGTTHTKIISEEERNIESIECETLLDYVLEFRDIYYSHGISSIKPDRFVVIYVVEQLGRDWESPLMRIIADICTLIAEVMIGHSEEHRDYTIHEDNEGSIIRSFLRERICPGIILVVRSRKELPDYLARDILREADRARSLGFLIINRSAISKDVWNSEVEIQPCHRLDIIVKPILSYEKLKKGLCLIAAALSGFSMNEDDILQNIGESALALEKVVSMSIRTFRRLIEDINKKAEVAAFNKPSSEKESTLHRLLKGWAIWWLIKRFFDENFEYAKDRIHVEKQLEERSSYGIPDIYAKLPDGRRLIVEVKTLLGKGVNPIWDELYHNDQIRRYAHCADEVWILVPPWIPILFTRALLDVQKMYSKDNTLNNVKIVTIYFESKDNVNIIPVTRYIKLVKSKLRENIK